MSADNTLAAFCDATSASGGVAIDGDATTADAIALDATATDATAAEAPTTVVEAPAIGEEEGGSGDSSMEC